MLSASIPSAIGPRATDTNLSTNTAPVQTATNSLPQNRFVSETRGDVFSGQWNDALETLNEAALNGEPATTEVDAHALDGERAEPLPGDQQDQGQQPNAEAWLQTMLDQQQLQVQTHDRVAATEPAGVVSANAAVTANNPLTPAPLATPAALVSVNPLADAVDVAGQTQVKPVDTAAVSSIAGSLALPTQPANPAAVAEIANSRSLANSASVAPAVNPAVNTAVDVSLNPSTNSPIAINAGTTTTGTTTTGTTASAATVAALVSAALGDAAPLGETHAADAIAFHAAPLSASAGESGARVQPPLTLQAPEAKWGEQLLHALRDNVQVQIQQKIQHATIRLDPPELGSLEIFLSHESGRLTVQITSSQADVARLIQATSERLRQELSGPQFTQVNVQTSTDQQGSQQQSRERQRFINDDRILANEQEFAGNGPVTKRSGDVLVTA